jgi:heat shock protein HslJ
MLRSLIGGVLVLAAIALAACQQTPRQTIGVTASSLAGEWTLVSIEGRDVGELLPQGLRQPSIMITEDARVSGFGGVNRLRSSLDQAALPFGEFKMGPIASTKMAGAPEAMDLENRFTRLLRETSAFRLTGDTLIVWREGEGPAMKFTKAP